MKPGKIEPQELVPTPERMSRGEVVRIETIQAGVHAHIDRRASLLDAYWRDQLLLGGGMDPETAAARHQAGLRLQLLYEATGLRQRQTASYGPRSRSHEDPTSHHKNCKCLACEQLAAHDAYNQIVRKLTFKSPSVASATVNLCIHEMDPVDRKDLIIGLDMLIRHWGM